MQIRQTPGRPDSAAAGCARLLGWLAIVVLLHASWVHLVPHFGRRVQVGLDFRIYWAAGGLANRGENPYRAIMGGLGFVYPPFALLPFQLLARLSRSTAFSTWLWFDALLAVWLLIIAHRRHLRTGGVLLSAATFFMCGYVTRCTTMGQIGVVLLALVATDVQFFKNPRWQGLLTGVAAGVKFTPAIFILYFLARRNWRCAINAAVGFAGSVLVGAVLSPTASRNYWQELIQHHRLGVGVPSQYGTANNQSLTNAVVMLLGVHGGHVALGRLVAIAATLVGVAAGCLASRADRSWLSLGVLGATSCLLTSSTWDHHYVWIIFAVLALLSGECRGLRRTSVGLVVWLLWSITRWWRPLATIPRSDFSALQLLGAVATPVLALLFVGLAAIDLMFVHRSSSAMGAERASAAAR